MPLIYWCIEINLDKKTLDFLLISINRRKKSSQKDKDFLDAFWRSMSRVTLPFMGIIYTVYTIKKEMFNFYSELM